MFRPGVRLLFLLITVVVLPLAAVMVLMFALGGLENYQSAHTPSLSPAGAGARRTETVVMIVVDGLRLDHARTMKSYQYLAGNGAELTATAPVPSLTAPVVATLATGAPTEVHGMTTNRAPGPITANTIFHSLAEADITAVAVGGPWGRLVGHYVAAYQPIDGREVSNAARELLASKPGLLVVHFKEVDLAGHVYGATDSRYQETVDQVDRLITEVLAEIVLEDTVVILLSDHGHIARGGHGGTEPEVLTVPLVLAGPGVVPGSYDQVLLTDVAPTLAALLGVAQPVHASGRILTEIFTDVDRDALTGSLVSSAQAASAYVQGLGRSPVRRVADIAMVEASSSGQYLQLMEELNSIRVEAREELIAEVATGRMLMIGIPLLLWLAAAVFAAGRRQPVVLLILALVPFLAASVLWTLLPVSASRFVDYGDALFLFAARGAASALVTIAISAVMIKLMRPQQPIDAGLAVAGVCAGAAVLLTLTAVPGSGTLLVRGVVPDLERGLMLLTATGALAGNGVAAPVMILIAMKTMRHQISA